MSALGWSFTAEMEARRAEPLRRKIVAKLSRCAGKELTATWREEKTFHRPSGKPH